MIVHLESGDRLPSVALAEDLIVTYDLDERTARRLLAVARPFAGRSSPYRIDGGRWSAQLGAGVA